MSSLDIWITLCLMAVVAVRAPVRFQIVKNYERTFSNGPGGECELSSPAMRSGRRSNAREVICPTNWVPNGTITTDRRSLPGKKRCRYATKSNRYLCYGSKEGINGSVTCQKTVSHYLATKACSDTWLPWERCDKSCNGGITKRVKFSLEKNMYDKTVEYRPCNTHECPRWGVWRPQTSDNDTIQCNISSCTRKWERECIFKNTTVSIRLCAEEGYDAVSEREMDCSPEECIQATTIRQADRTSSENKKSLERTTSSIDIYATSQTGPEPTSSAEWSALLNSQGISVIAPETDNKIGLGFGIGFLTSLFLFTTALLAKRQWSHRKKGIGARKWDSSRTDSSRESASTPFRLERIAAPSAADEEGLYSTVGQHAQATRNQNVYSLEVDVLNNSPLIGNGAYSDGADQNPSDPLYSAIPAYESNAAGGYPSSEFDSSAEESASEARSSRLPSSEIEKEDSELTAPTGERAEEGCKSFDSDEDRDIVHTLRKQSTKNKRSPTTDGLEDVFLSDDEVCEEQHNTERKFAFSRRYSKILAKKAKKSLSWGRNEPVEAGFKWVDGRRLTASTNSDCSTQSTSQVCDWETANGPRMLPRQSSLGAFSSAVSVNADGATSGYNSAMGGDSTDDERSMWVKRRMTHSQTPSRNHAIRKKDSMEHHRRSSRERISFFATERRNHFGDIRPKPQNSCVGSELLAHSSGSNRALNTCENVDVRPFHTMKPTSQRSLSLISRQGRIIPVEDIYSSPIDAEAQNVEKSEHWEYDLPVDALRNRSVVN